MPYKNYNGASHDEYFWLNVNKNGPLPELRPDLGPCWEWMANISPTGYGRYHYRGIICQAHVYGYNLFHDPIPNELEHDHLCRNRKCVRDGHLEPVTRKVNILRGVSPPALNAIRIHCETCGWELSFTKTKKRRYCTKCNAKRATEHYHGKVKPAQDKYREENGIDISNLPQFNALKTECKRGHPLDGIQKKTGRRYCKTCNRDASNAKYRRLVEEKHKK